MNKKHKKILPQQLKSKKLLLTVGVLSCVTQITANARDLDGVVRNTHSTGGQDRNPNVQIGSGTETNNACNDKNTVWGSGNTSGEENNCKSLTTAWGKDTKATGYASTSFGEQTKASDSYSTAFGFNTEAKGKLSTAFGVETQAIGEKSTAFGRNTKATDDQATAWGDTTEASGKNSTAFGRNTKATDDQATAWGDTTEASGKNSTAFGYKSQAKGDNSLAFGVESYANKANSLAALGGTADGENSAAIGKNALAKFDGSIALGSGSVADRDSSETGKNPLENENLGSGPAWTSMLPAVSVGTSTQTRQIIGVAAASEDTDAVNLAQLKAVADGAYWVAKKSADETGGYKVSAGKEVVFQGEKDGNVTVTYKDEGVFEFAVGTADLTGNDLFYSDGKANIADLEQSKLLITANDAANIANNVAWNIRAYDSSNANPPEYKQVKAGDKVDIVAGDGLKLSQTNSDAGTEIKLQNAWTISQDNNGKTTIKDGNQTIEIEKTIDTNTVTTLTTQGQAANATNGNLILKKDKEDEYKYDLSLNDEITLGSNSKDGNLTVEKAGAKTVIKANEINFTNKSGVIENLQSHNLDDVGKENQAATVEDVLNSGWYAKVGDSNNSILHGYTVDFQDGQNSKVIASETDKKTLALKIETAGLKKAENANELIQVSGGDWDETNKRYNNYEISLNTDTLKKQLQPIKFRADGTDSELLTPDFGETVNFVGDENITVTSIDGDSNDKKIQVSLNDAVILGDSGSLTIGNTKLSNNSLTFTSNNGTIDGLKTHFDINGKSLNSDGSVPANQAATVQDVLNSGWYLQVGGAESKYISSGKAVNFAAGKGTTVAVEYEKNTNTVKYNADVSKVTIKDGKVTGITYNGKDYDIAQTTDTNTITTLKEKTGNIVVEKDKDDYNYDISLADDLTINSIDTNVLKAGTDDVLQVSGRQASYTPTIKYENGSNGTSLVNKSYVDNARTNISTDSRNIGYVETVNSDTGQITYELKSADIKGDEYIKIEGGTVAQNGEVTDYQLTFDASQLKTDIANAKVKIQEGSNVSIEEKTENGQTTYIVSSRGVQQDQNNKYVTVSGGGNDDFVITDRGIDDAITAAIKESAKTTSFNLSIDGNISGDKPEVYKVGKDATVTIKAGDNLEVSQNDGEITLATKDTQTLQNLTISGTATYKNSEVVNKEYADSLAWTVKGAGNANGGKFEPVGIKANDALTLTAGSGLTLQQKERDFEFAVNRAANYQKLDSGKITGGEQDKYWDSLQTANAINDATSSLGFYAIGGSNVTGADRQLIKNGGELQISAATGIKIEQKTDNEKGNTEFVIGLDDANQNNLNSAMQGFQTRVVANGNTTVAQTIDKTKNNADFVQGSNIVLTPSEQGITVATAKNVTFDTVKTNSLTASNTTLSGNTIISGVATYTGRIENDSDLVNKKYVDDAVGGIKITPIEVEEGKNTEVSKQDNKYTVNAYDTKLSTTNSLLEITGGDLNNDLIREYEIDVKTSKLAVNNGKVTADGDNLTTASNVADVINQSYWTASDGKTEQKIKLGEGISFVGTNGITVNNNDGQFTIGFSGNSGAKNTAITNTDGNLRITSSTNGDTNNYEVNLNNQIALGDNGQISAGSTVMNSDGIALGSGVGLYDTGLDNAGYRVTNVGNAVEDSDAVNLGQLRNALSGVVAPSLGAMEGRINQRIESVDRHASAGIAQSLAAATMPHSALPGEGVMGVSGGSYRGESGYAVGYSHMSTSGNWRFKATGSGNSRGHYGVAAGIGWRLY